MWCKGGISKIQIAIGSLGHAIKVLFGPAGSFISPAGSKSINKRPCYCQDAPPRRAFLGCRWYHDMECNLMTSATTEKRCLLITFWAPKHRFGCQKSCIRQLPALAFTHSKDARRQRGACGHNWETSHQHLPGWAEKEGASSYGIGKPLETNQLPWRAGWGAGTSHSPPDRDHPRLILPGSAAVCTKVVQCLGASSMSGNLPAYFPIFCSFFFSLLNHSLSFLLHHPHKQPWGKDLFAMGFSALTAHCKVPHQPGSVVPVPLHITA